MVDIQIILDISDIYSDSVALRSPYGISNDSPVHDFYVPVLSLAAVNVLSRVPKRSRAFFCFRICA